MISVDDNNTAVVVMDATASIAMCTSWATSSCLPVPQYLTWWILEEVDGEQNKSNEVAENEDQSQTITILAEADAEETGLPSADRYNCNIMNPRSLIKAFSFIKCT